MKNIILFLSMVLMFSSCFKEEDKIDDHSTGTIIIKLGEDYGNQLFFNLSTQKIVSENKWDIWNLAFYAQDDDYYIKLCHPANMKAFKTAQNFEEINVLDSTLEPKVDKGNGNRDEIALDFKIVETRNDTNFYENETYVLSLGTSGLGEDLGYKKIQLVYTYHNSYFIKYANLDGTEEVEDFIEKDNTLNYVYYSFNNGGETVNVEPDKTTWDLLISRSTDLAVGDTITISDYSVVSVLLNPYSTEAYVERELAYKDQIETNIKHSNFSSAWNIIGYYWKFYNIEKAQYSIIPNKHYVVKDINDYYYKLKFLSFYDPDTNLKGTVSFEYKTL